MSNNNSYKNIVKSTSIFGGVQMLNIIIQIIKSKVLAILLGASGFGTIGLFQSTIQIIQSSTNFGLNVSAVKDVSEAYKDNDKNKLIDILATFKKLIILSGILGFLIMSIGSPFLSEFTFGNKDYTYHFIFLSIVLLFDQIKIGYGVILQGTRKISYLAKASILTSLSSLILSLILFYFIGENGIVPVLICTSIAAYLVHLYYIKKTKVDSKHISIKEALSKGKSMLKIGAMISLASLFTLLSSYLIKIFIRNIGGLNDIGLYTAGFAILGSYMSLIFSAMSTDYYPKLAAMKTFKEYNVFIKEQSEITLFVIAPLICVLIVHIDNITILLYSKDFLNIVPMIQWASIGILFKSISWILGYLLLTRGEIKFIFWNEIINSIYTLALNILGYYYFRLEGLGISFLIAYILQFIQIYLICKLRYNFEINKSLTKAFLKYFLICTLCFSITFFFKNNIYTQVLSNLTTLYIIYISFYDLNSKIEIIKLIKSKLKI